MADVVAGILFFLVVAFCLPKLVWAEADKPVVITITVQGIQQAHALNSSHFVVTDNGQIQAFDVLADPSGQSQLSVALVLEEGAADSLNNQLATLRKFVEELPAGTHVMVAKIDQNHANVVVPLTADLKKAAQSIPIVQNYVDQVPLNTFVSLSEVLEQFKGIAGRKEVVLIGSGFDTLQDENNPTFNTDLQLAEAKACRENVVVHTIWIPATGHFRSHWNLVGASNLLNLADSTGGLAFWNTDEAVVLDLTPHLNLIREALDNQYIISFSPDLPSKRNHRIKVALKDVPAGNTAKVVYPEK
jgi:hypothetical protein